MSHGSRMQRFLGSTRGQILELLRRSKRTAGDLSGLLGITESGVRAHLAGMERDGLVQQAGTRPAFRKPTIVYEMTPAAEQLYPKAYAAVLRTMLDVLGTRLSPEDLERSLDEIGRRLAEPYVRRVEGQPGADRARAGLAAVADIGGLAELEPQPDGRAVIRGCSCPLAEAVPSHPQVCRVAQAMLADILGRPVVERCDKGDPPRCRFEVTPDV